MGTRIANPNVAAIKLAARRMGATVLKVEHSPKHHGVHIRTREGVEFVMRVSKGRIDPFKQKGWTRQAINRANRKEVAKHLTLRT